MLLCLWLMSHGLYWSKNAFVIRFPLDDDVFVNKHSNLAPNLIYNDRYFRFGSVVFRAFIHFLCVCVSVLQMFYACYRVYEKSSHPRHHALYDNELVSNLLCSVWKSGKERDTQKTWNENYQRHKFTLLADAVMLMRWSRFNGTHISNSCSRLTKFQCG